MSSPTPSSPEPDPAPGESPASSSPTAPDPEDWRATGGSADDERYLRERPPHWQ